MFGIVLYFYARMAYVRAVRLTYIHSRVATSNALAAVDAMHRIINNLLNLMVLQVL